MFATFGLTELTVHPKSGVIFEATNLTILNFFLVRFGPMNEKRLVQVLMCSQVCENMITSVGFRLLTFHLRNRLQEALWLSSSVMVSRGWCMMVIDVDFGA